MWGIICAGRPCVMTSKSASMPMVHRGYICSALSCHWCLTLKAISASLASVTWASSDRGHAPWQAMGIDVHTHLSSQRNLCRCMESCVTFCPAGAQVGHRRVGSALGRRALLQLRRGLPGHAHLPARQVRVRVRVPVLPQLPVRARGHRAPGLELHQPHVQLQARTISYHTARLHTLL